MAESEAIDEAQVGLTALRGRMEDGVLVTMGAGALPGKRKSGVRRVAPAKKKSVPSEDTRRLVQRLIVERESGKGFVVRKGQCLRVIAIDGQQVCDFNAFNLQNPDEAFWAGGTRSLEGTHLTVGGQLWSKPPWSRVMFTIVTDTVKQRPNRKGFRSHDLLFSRCNPRLYDKRGMPGHANCHQNLARGIRPFKLPETAVHDAFNIFMKTCALPNGTQKYMDPDAKKGDYMELRAEMDCIVSLSACPGRSSGPRTRRLGVEIYDA